LEEKQVQFQHNQQQQRPEVEDVPMIDVPPTGDCDDETDVDSYFADQTLAEQLPSNVRNVKKANLRIDQLRAEVTSFMFGIQTAGLNI
jgi:hypothetical protein